jgi:23S rRNA (cytosine1962-C5)-methyltransferase
MTSSVPQLLDRAFERRRELVAELERDTDAWRIVHGSADGLDGLTVDRLGPAVLVERHRRDAAAEPLVDALDRRLGSGVPVFLKERWSSDPRELAGNQVRGPEIGAGIAVRERGIVFVVHLTAGEHVGLFLDARPARELVRARAGEQRVLNLFSYTGGFGVVAAAGGARSTTNVDAKRSALEAARRNYELNRLAADTRTFLRDDAIRFLTRAAKGAGRYDLVVLDPPPRFERAGGKTFDTRNRYGRLVARCLAVLDDGGLLLAGANFLGHGFDELECAVLDAARESGRGVGVVERIGPDADFPPAPERPVGRYLLCSAV